MMQIDIVTVGKLKEKYWTDAVQEYMKRLQAYCKCRVVELAEEKGSETAGDAEIERMITKEGERILASIGADAVLVAMAIEGELWTSEKLAKSLDEWGIRGKSKVAFVIGGSHGLSEAVMKRADAKLSLSKMTFPHQMVRPILLEQIYRAFKINRGEQYHK